MRKRTKRLLVPVCSALLFCLLGLGWVGYIIFGPGYSSSVQKLSAMDCILSWARLAPFPAAAKETSVSDQGTAYTRSFRASFMAPGADIEKWLQECPGTREATPTRPTIGVRRYLIVPGSGAKHAEVTVDDRKNRVSIYVYWS